MTNRADNGDGDDIVTYDGISNLADKIEVAIEGSMPTQVKIALTDRLAYMIALHKVGGMIELDFYIGLLADKVKAYELILEGDKP